MGGDGTTVESMSIDLSLGNDYTVEGSPSAIFMSKITGIDKWLLQAASDHSKAWFGKDMGLDLVGEFTKSMVVQRNPQYPPLVKAKIPIFNGKPSTLVFNEAGEQVDLDYVSKGSTVRAMIEVSSIWFMSGRTFGISLRVVRIGVVEKPRKVEEMDFCVDEDDTGMIDAAATAFLDD